jgi:short-subunit dehydrogenase
MEQTEYNKFMPTTYSSLRCLKQTSIFLATILVFTFGGCATSKLGTAGQQKISGKTFVIIGASSGFGRGVAEQLGSYGANVVVAARRTDVLQELATKVEANGGKAMVATVDINKPEDIERLLKATIERFGKVDVWINTTGVGAIGRFWEIPIKDQLQVVETNLKGVIYSSYTAINQFKKQGYGTLINLGSIESVSPLAYHATYAATKGGIRNLDQAINYELKLNGDKEIKIVTIEPWAADTPFWGHAANYSGGTPRMAAMDTPTKVVNAIIRTSLRPRKELAVGWKAKSVKFMHAIFPHFTEKLSARIAHHYQLETAPPAPPTTGSVHQPLRTGTGVDDGVKMRMKKERKQRRQSGFGNSDLKF